MSGTFHSDESKGTSDSDSLIWDLTMKAQQSPYVAASLGDEQISVALSEIVLKPEFEHSRPSGKPNGDSSKSKPPHSNSSYAANHAAEQALSALPREPPKVAHVSFCVCS